MTRDQNTPPANRDPDGSLSVLHVDEPDRTKTFERFLDDRAYAVDLVAEPSLSAARSRLEALDIDCVVVGSAFPEGETIAFIETIDGLDREFPVIYFSEADPNEISDELLELADTIVQDGPGEAWLEFLVKKIQTARSDPAGASSSRPVSPVGLALRDERGAIVWTNDGLADLFPRTDATDGGETDERQPAGGTIAEQLLNPDEFRRALSTAIDEDAAIVGRRIAVQSADGTDGRELVWTSEPLPEDGQGARIDVYRDPDDGWNETTELKTMVESARDGLYRLDTNGNFAYLNESLADMLGYEREELLGTHASICMIEGELEKGQKVVQQLVADDKRESELHDIVFETKDGDRIITEIHYSILRTEDSEYDGVMGVLRDVTERRKQERLLRRQKSQLDRFASVVAHDLRNPLAVMKGNLDLYDETGDRDRLAEVDAALDRMEGMIDNLLVLAKAGVVVDDPEPIDVDAVVRECWEGVPTHGATLERAGSIGTVAGDRERLTQLFENLVRNSIEHGTDADRLAVSGDGDGKDCEANDGTNSAGGDENGADGDENAETADVTITVGPLSDGGFFFEDDGPGIPDEERDRVFDHGYTTNQDGTGFGLSIVAEIVDAHGWEIEATDAADGGARFDVRIGGDEESAATGGEPF